MSATAVISYADLYARWERSNWLATEIDFTQDRRRLARGADGRAAPQRALELLALLPRRGLGRRQPLAVHRRRAAGGAEVLPHDAAGRRGAPRRLLPPLHARGRRRRRRVDRARRCAPPTAELTWGLRKMFDRLDQMADELRTDRSRPQLARAVTLYHIVIEATLAQPGQHFIERYLEERDLLPGLPRGHAQRLAGRAAPHRLRRQAAGRPVRARTRSGSATRSSPTLREVLP